MSETHISRRTFLKLGAAAAAAVAVAKHGGPAIDVLGKAFDRRNQLPDNLLKPVTVPTSKEAEENWRKTYQVRSDDTISSIANRFYPDFDNNQPFYTYKLRYANEQAPDKNSLIYAGQTLYIPDPRIPTLGFAAGESAILRGQEVDGRYWPTVVRIVDTKARRVEVVYRNWIVFNGVLKVGEKLTTDRTLNIAAVLEGEPSPLVPPRVVFEITG